MARAADLKEDIVLPLQQNLAIVEAARQIHDPKCPDERFGIKFIG